MECEFLNDISDAWVQEKLHCTNVNERERTRRIEERIKSKFEEGPQYFTADEFKDFLIWKGLARSVQAFLRQYDGKGEVEEVTRALFTNELTKLTFAEVQGEPSRNKILEEINDLFQGLQRLKFVGPGVASACVALCFPELCGTADYIVPAILHNEYDSLKNKNPLFANQDTAQKIREALLLPLHNSLSASGARFFATQNYTVYVQELWNIKRGFGLNHQVRRIEEAIWSLGICYIKKNTEVLPLIFNTEPKPPKAGPFSKRCPN
jgi:hypothetical protein